MHLQLLLELIKARSLLVFFTLFVTVLVTTIFTVRETKMYSASTSLVLTFRDSSPFEQLGVPSQLASSYVATQVDIIVSHNVALKVVDSLQLLSSQASVEEFLFRNDGFRSELPEPGDADRGEKRSDPSATPAFGIRRAAGKQPSFRTSIQGVTLS